MTVWGNTAPWITEACHNSCLQRGGKEKNHWKLAKGAVACGGEKSSTEGTDEAALPTTAEALIGFLCLPKGSTTRERWGIVEEVQYTVTDT